MSAADDLDTVFMLAGFSWLTGSFRIWTLRYDRAGKRFRYVSAARWAGDKYFMFAGDEIPTAKRRLHELLKARGKGASADFDMEPFEVLRDMIRDPSYQTIGGPPQVLKVYRHMNVMPYAVAWPARGGPVTLLGRELLDYEKTSFLILDPDSLNTFEAPVAKLLATRAR